jgi:hypothetical protein
VGEGCDLLHQMPDNGLETIISMSCRDEGFDVGDGGGRRDVGHDGNVRKENEDGLKKE